MRTLTEAFIDELMAGLKRPLIFFEGAFSEGVVRAWSGLGTIEWDGKTWQGVGDLGGISAVEETTDVRALGVSVSLSGIPPELVAAVLGETRQGAPGKIWLGFLTEAGEIVADPAMVFSGRMDVPEITEDGTSAVITIAYESRWRDIERAREWRYTHESQQVFFPGDRGFEYVPSLQEWNGVWYRG